MTPTLQNGFVRHILNSIARKRLSLTAAGLAYYFLMSLFPAVVLATTLSSYVPLRNGVQDAMAFLYYVMPQQGESMIRDIVRRIGTRHTGLLSIAFVTTLWLASSAFKGVILSLDTAYGVENSRRPWVNRLVAPRADILDWGIAVASNPGNDSTDRSWRHGRDSYLAANLVGPRLLLSPLWGTA